ncbi:AraC-like DNA-binding protein [Natranaerovirga hydrolytica]|uniref:AraC-like DNA-binding protein n=1 Tax=Natranaerovirga hydrolytica TaxID=680378 RepID=A0A4R1N5T7_9FIRM|nr:AraC family transcriptional regulator [Natranaerovirga hydrolytica]TCK97983.1 AraC-like DNA-binding protein [Natranaerovirga hydrolytica]
MSIMYYTWENKKRDIDLKQYVYDINFYHYNWHEALELMIILKGEVEISANGKVHILEENDLILLNSNVGHATLARKSKSIAMVIHLDPIYFSSYYNDYHLLDFNCISNRKTRNEFPFIQIRKLAIEMSQVIHSNSPVDKIYFEGLLHQVMATVVKNFPPTEISTIEMASNKKEKDTVRKIIGYIDHHYKEKISLEELSYLYGYHKNYISHIVKQQLGINYYQYLTRIRLREATYALLDFEERISDIALSHGFSDVKSFNTAFKTSFGKTPSEYRRHLSKKKSSLNQLRKKRYLQVDEYEKIIKNKIKTNLDNPIANSQLIEENKTNEIEYQTLIEIKKNLRDCIIKIDEMKFEQ